MTNRQWILLIILVFALAKLSLWQQALKDEKRYRPPTPPPPHQPWNQLHFDFNHSEYLQLWQAAGYDYSTTRKWIESGVKPAELELVKWIKEVKRLSPEYIINHWGNVNPLRDEWSRRNVPKDSSLRFYH